MNDKGKKIILIVLGILLIIITVIVLLFGNKSNNNEIDNTGDNSNVYEISKKIVRLDNENEFFDIESTINVYYDKVYSKDSTYLFNVLDIEYKNENGITEDNVLSKTKNNELDTNFVAKKIYYNNDSRTNYYFVNGYTISESFSESIYVPNVNYLIIVKNNIYTIKPLEIVSDISSYANNYNIIDVNMNSGEEINRTNYNELNIINKYINIFTNNLINDREQAYNMLGEKTKNKYVDYNDFTSKIDDIYKLISSRVFVYNKKGMLYEVVTYDQYDITITEYYPNEFVIDY